MAELADALDLGSNAQKACRFKSCSRHHLHFRRQSRPRDGRSELASPRHRTGVNPRSTSLNYSTSASTNAKGPRHVLCSEIPGQLLRRPPNPRHSKGIAVNPRLKFCFIDCTRPLLQNRTRWDLKFQEGNEHAS